jgi:hypothetical protein
VNFFVFMKTTEFVNRVRGSKSVRRDIRVCREKPCSLKRHFAGALRQVIGLAEKLAANDPERFIWASARAFIKHARKGEHGAYSERQVQYSLGVAEALGVLVPAQKARHSTSRTGWIVRSHEDLSKIAGPFCILHLATNSAVGQGRRRGQTRGDILRKLAVDGIPPTIASPEAYKSGNSSYATTSRSASLITSGNAASAPPNASQIASEDTRECISDNAPYYICESSESSVGGASSGADVEERARGVLQNMQAEPSNPINPFKKNPVNPPTHQPWPTQSHDWLVGRVCNILEQQNEELFIPTSSEKQKLTALSAKEGELRVLAAFYQFVERPQGLRGLSYPITLFVQEAHHWIRFADKKRREPPHPPEALERVSAMAEDFGIYLEQEECMQLSEVSFLQGRYQYDSEIVENYLSYRASEFRSGSRKGY